MTLTKEWLQNTIAQLEEERDATPGAVNEDAAMALAAMKLALASLEAGPVGYIDAEYTDLIKSAHIESCSVYSEPGEGFIALYTAPPAPVSVPAAMEMDDDFDSAFEHGKAVGWNAYRAAMLQGSDGTLTNEGTITATKFKPVADLYGLTSPTGGETSFTFDAVEARDFIDGGWSCQEYVELERFQEAVSGNSPVIPDGWVACSERMPEIGIKVLCFPVNDEPIHATYNGQVWLQDISWSASDEPIDNVISCNVFHWMPLPAAPQQEA